ncbi:MAG: CBS domain-containing protein [Clostridia bacterium]|nr:CBS domain-containing protein [Clostridia bacterium]
MLNNNPQSKLRIEDMMTTGVITVLPHMTMRQAKETMRLKNISGMPVIDHANRLIGIVTVADVIQALDEQKLDLPIKERMTTRVHSIKPYESVNKALAIFRQHGYGRLPVVDDQNRVVGIITTNDIVKRLAKYLRLDEIEEITDFPNKTVQNHTLSFNIKGGDFDRAGLAASTIKKKLAELGISHDIIRRAAIAIYEAEMNIVIHAFEGQIWAHISKDKLQITVSDTGPGIEDIEQAMQVGFSTATDQIRELGFGAGMGLPNIKNSSDKFTITSTPGKGTELDIQIFLN